MKKGKKIAAVAAAMALTACVAVGGTMAYLQSVTQTATNTFTSSKNISTELTEDKWDKDAGKDYFPGQTLAKNPVMNNASETEAIYTSVKLEFVDNDGNNVSYDTFKKYAEMQGFSTNWSQIGEYADGSELWAYNTAVAAGASTEAIFTGVKVNAGITKVWNTACKTTTIYKVDADGNKTLVDTTTSPVVQTETYVDADGNIVADATTLPTFEIKVTGYSVQASGAENLGDATESLLDLAGATALAQN